MNCGKVQVVVGILYIGYNNVSGVRRCSKLSKDEM